MDESLLLAINGLRAPWLDAVLGPLSQWGIYGLLLLMLVGLARWREHARSVRDGWLAWFVGLYLTEMVIKPIVGRPRPTADEQLREALEVLGKMPSEGSVSFPSGTASAAFAASTWIWLRFGHVPGALATALASVIGLSRVYAGVHWPTDILAGALVGAGVAYGWHRLAKRIEQLPAKA